MRASGLAAAALVVVTAVAEARPAGKATDGAVRARVPSSPIPTPENGQASPTGRQVPPQEGVDTAAEESRALSDEKRHESGQAAGELGASRTSTPLGRHEPRSQAASRRGRGAKKTRAHLPRRSLAQVDAEQASSPSYRYANLSNEACRDELVTRRIVHEPAGESRGVLFPVRIHEGVGGVRFHTGLTPERRKTSPWDVFDCRLVLALDDFAQVLLARGYDDVLIFSGWRPPPNSWPRGKQAHRHPGGLAVDIKALRSSSDPLGVETLDVEADYRGRIDAPSCGPDGQVPEPLTTKTVALREILCEAVEHRIFTSVLTPNHDRPHANHFHLELTPNVPWRIVR